MRKYGSLSLVAYDDDVHKHSHPIVSAPHRLKSGYNIHACTKCGMQTDARAIVVVSENGS